jgi:hypothetical protein
MIRQHRLTMGMASVLMGLGVEGGPVPAIPPGNSHSAADVLPAPGSDERARPGTIPSDQEQQITELRRIGGMVFERDGIVVEVNLHRTRISDKDLGRLAGFTAMTDLSLEETAISDDGLRRLSGLKNLIWLNLYRTGVGDGLSRIKGLSKLEHLLALLGCSPRFRTRAINPQVQRD